MAKDSAMSTPGQDLPRPAYAGTESLALAAPTAAEIVRQLRAMVEAMAQGSTELLDSVYEIRPIYEPSTDTEPDRKWRDAEFFERMRKYHSCAQLRRLCEKAELMRAASQDRCNVFVGVNPRTEYANGRCGGTKQFIKRVWFAHADADGMSADEVLACLVAVGVRPTVLLRSSPTGCHVWIRLRAPLDTSAPEGIVRAEELNKRLALVFGSKSGGKGGDKCADISRVLRIPGTFNHPSAQKRRGGRVTSMAWLHSACHVQYSVDELEAVLPALPPRKAIAELALPVDISGISQNEREKQAVRFLRWLWKQDGDSGDRTARGVRNCRDMRILAHDFALGVGRAVEIIRAAGFEIEDDPYWESYIQAYCKSEPGKMLRAQPQEQAALKAKQVG